MFDPENTFGILGLMIFYSRYTRLREETSVEIIDWNKTILHAIQTTASGMGNVVFNVSPKPQIIASLCHIDFLSHDAL